MNKIKSNFDEHGYYIYPGLISHKKIDQLLEQLDIFKKRNFIYYSQSEHNWRRAKDDLDKNNLLNCSFENFTDLLWSPWLSKSGRNILQSQEINSVLQAISGKKEFCMWQNMFFDKSTGTVDHIDSWYLDSNPIGSLIAVWVALEDIDGRGGEFHVYPKSHLNRDLSWAKLNHNDFLNWSKDQSKNYDKKSFLIKKGDALFWHPLLLHGSSSQREKSFSRKSITAHYYPKDFLRGGKGKNQIINEDYKRKVETQNKSIRKFGYPIYSRVTRRSIAKFSLFGLIKNLIDFNNSPKMFMNRLRYKTKQSINEK